MNTIVSKTYYNIVQKLVTSLHMITVLNLCVKAVSKMKRFCTKRNALKPHAFNLFKNKLIIIVFMKFLFFQLFTRMHEMHTGIKMRLKRVFSLRGALVAHKITHSSK